METLEKIMKAADSYAHWKQDIALSHDRGTADDYEEAAQKAMESREELEQMIKDALLSVTK